MALNNKTRNMNSQVTPMLTETSHMPGAHPKSHNNSQLFNWKKKAVEKETPEIMNKKQSEESGINNEYLPPSHLENTFFDFCKVKDFTDRQQKRKEICKNSQINDLKKKNILDNRLTKVHFGINRIIHNESPRIGNYSSNKKLHFQELSIDKNTNFKVYNNNKMVLAKKRANFSVYQEEEVDAMTKTGYFSSIIHNCRNKDNKVTVRSIDPEKKLNKNISMIEPLSNTGLFLTFSKKENLEINRRRNKKDSTKKANMNSVIESYDYDSQKQILSEERPKLHGRPRDTPLKKIISLNKSIVDRNNNLKILCYKTPMEKEVNIKDLLLSDITKNFNKMTSNKSKYKLIQNEDSYKRLKKLESKLPMILKKNSSSIDLTGYPQGNSKLDINKIPLLISNAVLKSNLNLLNKNVSQHSNFSLSLYS